jgi:hypothetical protein
VQHAGWFSSSTKVLPRFATLPFEMKIKWAKKLAGIAE